MLPGVSIPVFEHGSAGPLVIVLHGGPGAPGDAAPLAEELGHDFRVLEPWQRRSGGEPLMVARHVEDLHEVVLACGHFRPAIVGHSWGAMLALSYASAHPDAAGPVVLVGCGTYDVDARAEFRRRAEKNGFDFDLAFERPEVVFDAAGHEETWTDVLRLQAEGKEPAGFSAITSSVLMVHGADDPHPGRMIGESLRPHIPQLEYVELERCGHWPWLERYARGEFLEAVREWLAIPR